MLTKDQVREIRAALTWGDHRYGTQKASDDDRTTITHHAMHRRALEMGLTKSKSLDDFLDQVTMADINEVLLEQRDPTSPDSMTSQPSANTGE